MVVENYFHHNIKPNYCRYMLEDLVSKQGGFYGGAALEYGCRAGKNLGGFNHEVQHGISID